MAHLFWLGQMLVEVSGALCQLEGIRSLASRRCRTGSYWLLRQTRS
jgi:hypothetical protein